MPKKEMSVEELVDYIEESRILKKVITGIIISGGEPFLKKGFEEFCMYFLKYFPVVNIGILSNLYNGSLIVSKLKSLNSFIDRIWIGTSLDGLGRFHDNTRGVNGAFDKFQESLSLLRKTFPGLPIVVNYTLTTDNYHDIYETYKFCKSHSLDLSIQFPVPWEGAEIFTFTNQQIAEIESLVMRVIEDHIREYEYSKINEKELMAKVFYLSGLIDYQKNPRRIFKRCVAGRRFTTISPEGKVYFCPILKNNIIGDLRDRPFDEIWMGKEARRLRKRIDRGFCHCWLNCTIYPNAMEALEAEKRDERKKSLIQRIFTAA
jgi:radical SAM protein with 4Fe4S-binding SPASM domain